MADADVDVGQLSVSQQEALEQYTQITNQDPAAAVPLLQRSQWNVQVLAPGPSPTARPANRRPDCHCQVLGRRRARSRGRSHGGAKRPTHVGPPRKSSRKLHGLVVVAGLAVAILTPRPDRRRPPSRSATTRDAPVTVARGSAFDAPWLGLASGLDPVPHLLLRPLLSPRLDTPARSHDGLEEYDGPPHAPAPRHGSEVQARV